MKRKDGSPKQHRTILRGGTVLTMVPSQREPLQCDIAIEGDRITEVANDIGVGDGDQVVDAAGMLILPGLVNAHVHSNEAFFKGRYDRLAFDAWGLYVYPLLASAPVTLELVYLRTMLAGMEALKSGVTFMIDDITDEISGQGIATLDAVFRAYRDLGIRATCSGNVMDRHALETLPAVGTAPPEAQEIQSLPLPTVPEFLEFCAEAHDKFHGMEGRLRFMVAPVAPQWCTDEMMVAAHDFAVRHGLQCHTHVLETKVQALIAQDHFGGSLVDHLAKLGVLTSHTNLIHAIWTSDDDIETIREHGASVVHNPHSNLKMGSGLAPFAQYLRSGIPVGLGTDGLASSDTTRLFEAIRLAVLIHRLKDPDPDLWPSAYNVIQAATIGGARVALMADEVGALKPGMRADIIMLDCDSLSLTPLNDPYIQLACCEAGSSVRHVMVNGDLVVVDGKLTHIDEEGIRTEIRRQVPAYLDNHVAVEQRHRVLERYMTDVDIAASNEFDRRRSIGQISSLTE